jgi:hypothetical protein
MPPPRPALPAAPLRPGTSKGLFFNPSSLPSLWERRQEFVKQLDGVKARRDLLAADVAQKRSTGAVRVAHWAAVLLQRVIHRGIGVGCEGVGGCGRNDPRHSVARLNRLLPPPPTLQWLAWKQR